MGAVEEEVVVVLAAVEPDNTGSWEGEELLAWGGEERWNCSSVISCDDQTSSDEVPRPSTSFSYNCSDLIPDSSCYY